MKDVVNTDNYVFEDEAVKQSSAGGIIPYALYEGPGEKPHHRSFSI